MKHEAMASTRVMSTCMALGEAAGRAARLALKAGVQPADLDVEALRAELRATGAYQRDCSAPYKMRARGPDSGTPRFVVTPCACNATARYPYAV